MLISHSSGSSAMDADFIKDEMVPKSVQRSSLFHGDTLRLLSAKLDPCDVVSLIYLLTDDDEANNKIYDKLSNMEEGISAKAVDFPNICRKLIPK